MIDASGRVAFVTPLKALLAEAIRRSHLPQAEVARRASIAASTLNACLHQREPDSTTLAKVLDTLGFDVKLVRKDDDDEHDRGADR